MNFEKAEKIETELRKKNEDHKFRKTVNSLSQQLLPKIQPYNVL